MEPPGKLPSKIKEEKTAVSYVKTFFLGQQNSSFPFARNQAKKTRDEHG